VTTKRAIIALALEEVGMAEYLFDASPETLDSFRRRLDTLAAQWDGMGIRRGYNLGGDIDAESGLPDTDIEAYSMNLACRMAPSFGKTLQPQTRISAVQGYQMLLTTQALRPEMPIPSRLPIGTGNRQGVLEQQYFPKNDGTVEGLNAGATEY
jgi:hypothetical protein